VEIVNNSQVTNGAEKSEEAGSPVEGVIEQGRNNGCIGGPAYGRLHRRGCDIYFNRYICVPPMNNGELDHILMDMGQRLLNNVRAESGKALSKFIERIIGSVHLLAARTLQRLMEKYSDGSLLPALRVVRFDSGWSSPHETLRDLSRLSDIHSIVDIFGTGDRETGFYLVVTIMLSLETNRCQIFDQQLDAEPIFRPTVSPGYF
jgi:hypothetical protein